MPGKWKRDAHRPIQLRFFKLFPNNYYCFNLDYTENEITTNSQNENKSCLKRSVVKPVSEVVILKNLQLSLALKFLLKDEISIFFN